MFQTQMITTVVDWERRQQIEDERRQNLRGDLDIDYVFAQTRKEERPSFFARLFGQRKVEPQPKPVLAGPNHSQQCC